ncbi:MAG: rhodanese-like domain-containing protein [Pseudomonadales bacterium]|nr:rhodanese-like domain-containing protein [Pseudomonadales bacterium]
MFNQVVEFVGNHWSLVGAFFVVLGLFVFTEQRKKGQSINTAELSRLVNKEDAMVVDLRDSGDFKKGHIVDSKNIPNTKLADRLGELESHKDKPIILVCPMGQLSGTAGGMLQKAGFTQVLRLNGGIGSWRAENLPLVK